MLSFLLFVLLFSTLAGSRPSRNGVSRGPTSQIAHRPRKNAPQKGKKVSHVERKKTRSPPSQTASKSRNQNPPLSSHPLPDNTAAPRYLHAIRSSLKQQEDEKNAFRNKFGRDASFFPEGFDIGFGVPYGSEDFGAEIRNALGQANSGEWRHFTPRHHDFYDKITVAIRSAEAQNRLFTLQNRCFPPRIIWPRVLESNPL